MSVTATSKTSTGQRFADSTPTRGIAVMAMACMLALLGGCATGSSTSAMDAGSGFNVDGAVNRPANPGQSWIARAGIRPFGLVDFDSFSLPLPSPDGQFVATQAGIAPTWSTALAEPDAEPPSATRVEIHRVLYDADPERDQRAIEFVASVSEATLLGRSADNRGFLIEAPQDDGSRWIGKAHWHTGEVDWLVQDEYVNAFATFSHNGHLAWSRRAIDGEHYELVVRTRDGDEWTMPAEGGDWLMPVWSDADDWLFVLRLDGDVLSAIHANASSYVAFRQSRQGQTLAHGATTDTAYQTMNSTVTRPVQREVNHQLIFWHPAEATMAVWRPRSRRRPMELLEPGAFAAEIDRRDVALVSTEQSVQQQQIGQRGQRAELMSGTYVVRSIDREDWDYLVFSLDHLHRVGIGAMKLLDPRDD